MRSLTYREVLDEVQPHAFSATAIAAYIAAALAAGTSVYAGGKSASAKRKGKRMGANAEQMSRTGPDASTPTASRFSGSVPNQAGPDRGGGGARIGSILGEGGAMPASDKEQGFSLGIKSLGEDAPSEPQSFKVETADAQRAMPIEKIEATPPQQQSTGSMDSYASIANSLISAYAASRQGKMDPQPAAPLGPMNLQPSALRYGKM